MDYNFLSKTALFSEITPNEIHQIMGCLDGRTRFFGKGETIYHAGDTIQYLGIVLSGSVYIENNDLLGNKSILDVVLPGHVFAETYACMPKEPLMVNVVAAERSEILFVNVGQGLETCSNNCSFHGRLIKNLLFISAQKNMNLSRRIFHTRSKAIRGRLLSYLSDQATRKKALAFEIPFNRQQLADYLSVDRSALSNELSKMQKEGLITVNKNHFKIHQEILSEETFYGNYRN